VISDKPSVLITGASGGIGKALVEEFHRAGYLVLATDRKPPPEDLPFERFIQADLEQTVTNEHYADGIFGQVRDCLSGNQLNALVNNAAVQILGPCETISRADWQHTLDSNLLAPFFWTQAFLPQLESANGCVVNISSIHASQTKRGFAAYATSKAALSALTRNMAVDLGGRIRINAIEPAAVKTEMLIEGMTGGKKGLPELDSLHPIGRIADPAEVARVAVFLCSKSASFIHGSVLPVTGGIHACLKDSG
jgi:NAD(P)-dependent dehydrogenase (short-subunit alcohol dehydrogenase family)